jgi:hypothetical protein
MPFSKKPKFDKDYDPLNNRSFKDGDNVSDNLANNHFQFLEFYHVPSGYFVTFKAYLTNFTDDYSTDWKSEQVYGRMDPIVTYQRTGRKINCAFEIVGSSVQEAEQNMRRFSLLTQMLYPSYESDASSGEQSKDSENLSTIKTGPLFKVKFLNWIQNSSVPNSVGAEESGLLGWIGGFSFAPKMGDDGGVFQVGLDLYPKYYNVSFDLNIIHEHKLGWSDGALKGGAEKKSFLAGPDPRFAEFPYGKSTDVGSEKPQPNSLSKEQKERFQELNAASKKLIGGS